LDEAPIADIPAKDKPKLFELKYPTSFGLLNTVLKDSKSISMDLSIEFAPDTDFTDNFSFPEELMSTEILEPLTGTRSISPCPRLSYTPVRLGNFFNYSNKIEPSISARLPVNQFLKNVFYFCDKTTL